MDCTPEPAKEKVLVERPLSPVLSTGKKGGLLKFGGRLRKKSSRTNLSKRFVQNEMVHGNVERENACLYFMDLPDPSDSPEVRLKKLQGMEERRREYLKYLTEIHTDGEHTFISTKESDSVNFKKPLSPVVLKVKKECSQNSIQQENINSNKALNEKIVEKAVAKDSLEIVDTNNAEKQKNIALLNAGDVGASCIFDPAMVHCNTTLTDSQVNSIADEIESVVSKDDDAGAEEVQEKGSYFKYVSKFLNKFGKQKLVETSCVSQKQAVSDLNVHCQNILNLIDLVEKNSASSTTTVGTYECPAFHGFEEIAIDLSKEKAKYCSNVISHYEKINDKTVHNAVKKDTECSSCFLKNEVSERVSLSQIKNILQNDDFVTLYQNKERESYNSRKISDDMEFDKQKQTQEWYNSCFAEVDFKKHCDTSTMETQSNSMDMNSVNESNRSKSDKSVCHSPGFGFKCASGKQIKLSEKALLKAAKIFDEVIKEVKLGDTERQEQNNIETLHVNSKFSNNSLKDFTTSTTTTNKNYEESEIVADSVHTLQVQSAPTVMFTSASGKGIAISKNALAKAKQIFSEVGVDVNTFQKSMSAETPLSEFKTAAGSGISVSAEAIGAAQKIFVDINQNRDDTEICKTPTNEKKAPRKHLGISPRFKQIPIQQQNFEKAKKTFGDISGDMYDESFLRPIIKSAFSCHTPKRQQHCDSPYISAPICNSSPIFFDKFGSNTNQNFNKNKTNVSCKNIGTNIVISGITEGNINKWLEELIEERSKLEQQLNILSLKQQALQEQKEQLKPEKLKRAIPGTLYTKKRENVKIPLRKFVENVKPGEHQLQNFSSTLLHITPKTAHSVHFICKGVILETADGAKIIPNKKDFIGLSEIKVAFEAMPGVDHSLILKGWIENHYKWIVWKLASMERAFPYHFNECLTVENVMEQLKYRYDREIDRAERSALRRILENDDSPQKRMVLCVSDIKKGNGELYELELTDGWYAIRTIIDGPLNDAIKRQKLQIGFKIVTQGAELINCEGCHPLQAPECIYLKINYNSTRRAAWDTKLGFQNFPGPLLISLKSINFRGGPVGYIKVYLARVYPLRYMEKQENTVVWRNERAEEKRAKAFAAEQLKRLEDVQYEIESMYEKEMEEVRQRKKRKLDQQNSNEHPGSALYETLMHSVDPDSIMNELTPTQQADLADYKKHNLKEREEVLAARVKEAVNKSYMLNREVVPIAKLLVIDASDYSERSMVLNIWKPSDELLHILKEERVFSIYNVIPKNNGNLRSSCKTRFKEETISVSRFKKFARQVLPISVTAHAIPKPFLNEFDTVGIVVKSRIDATTQDLWLCDSTGGLLLIRVCDSPDHCSVFDHLVRGQVVAVSNLVLCESQNSFGFAIGNQHTLVTRYPKDKLLKEALDIFAKEPIENMDSLLNDCDKKVDVCLTKFNFMNTLQNRSYSKTLLARTTALNISDILTDSSEDEGSLPAKLTSLDIAMSLIDMESLTKN